MFSFLCHQALGYISGFSRAELPHVIERQTVKEDGTVVRRCVSDGVHLFEPVCVTSFVCLNFFL